MSFGWFVVVRRWHKVGLMLQRKVGTKLILILYEVGTWSSSTERRASLFNKEPCLLVHHWTTREGAGSSCST